MSESKRTTTPTPWRMYVQAILDKEAAKRELCRMVDGTPDFHPVMVYITDDEWDLAPAITGCSIRSEANAELIVRAVNERAELIEALRMVVSYLTTRDPNRGALLTPALNAAQAALARAEGRS